PCQSGNGRRNPRVCGSDPLASRAGSWPKTPTYREADVMSESEGPNRGSAEELSATLRSLPESDRTLLIVADDAPLCQRLARAMERRGFVVATADSVAGGIAAATDQLPAFAVVDMRLGDGRGFDVVTALRRARPGARIVMLTGYGNIATAVAAVKA